MKSFFKLTKGEILKLIKSKSILVMSIFMALCIGAMSVVYYFYDSDLNRLIDFLFADTPQVDIFDIMEGDLDEQVIAWADLYNISVTELTDQMSGLDDKPEIRLGLVNVKPAILGALAYADSVPGTPIPPELITNSTMYDAYLMQQVKGMISDELEEEFAKYKTYAQIQSVIADDYFNSLYAARKTTLRRLQDMSSFLQNGGEYGKSINEFIVGELLTLEEYYKTLRADFASFKTAHDEYLADSTETTKHELAQTKLRDVMISFDNFRSKTSDVLYYTNADTLGTNYLLIPTEDNSFSAAKYSELREALRPLSRDTYTSTRKVYNDLVKEREDRQTLKQFIIDYQLMVNEYNAETDAVLSKDISYDLALTSQPNVKTKVASFRDNLERLLNEELTDKNRIFFAYDEVIEAAANEYIADNTKLPSDAEQADKIKRYAEMFTDGKMTPFVSSIEASYKSTISKEEYEELIKPYFDDSEKQIIVELMSNMDKVRLFDNSQVSWVMRMLPEDMDKGAYTSSSTQTSQELYDTIKKNFKIISSKTRTIERLLQNTYALQTISSNELTDKETGNIYGFIFTSRYNLQSNITQTQFIITNDYQAESYVVPERVEGAYGLMQFVFVLTGMVIAFYGIFLGAGAIAGEHAAGTLKLLLIRPHTRFNVLAAKLFTIILALTLFTIINYGATIAVGAYWGFEAMSALAIVNSTTAIVLHPAVVLAIYHLCGLIQAIIYASIAMTIGTISKHKTVAVALTVFIMILAFILSGFLSQFAFYKYFIFNNADLSVYISSQGPTLADMNLFFSLIVNVAYLFVMGLVTTITFLRRDAA